MFRLIAFVSLLLALSLTRQTEPPVIEVDRRPIEVDDRGLPLVEVHLAASPTDPDRLAGAAMRADGQNWQVLAFASADGGDNWWSRELAPLEGMRMSGDPWLRWAPDGNLWLSMLGSIPVGDRDRFAVAVYHSEDGGDTWSGPNRLPWTESGSFDHPVLTSGDVPGEPLWLVGTYGLSGFLVLRSAGAADAFEIRGEYVPDELNNNLGSVVAWGDNVVFTYFDMSTSGADRPLWAVRDSGTEGGFSRSLIARGVVPWGFPMLAAGPRNGRAVPPLFATWSRAAGTEGLDVAVARSEDGGMTWRDGVVVNHHREPTFRGAPQVAVRADGVVGVAWNDRRHGDGEQCSDVFFAVSTDEGASFHPERRVSELTSCPFEADDTRPARRWPMGGDYSGLVVDAAGRFQLAWAEVRNRRFTLRSATIQVGVSRDDR